MPLLNKEDFNLWKNWKYWSLKKAGRIYVQEFVSSDNLLQNVFEKLKSLIEIGRFTCGELNLC